MLYTCHMASAYQNRCQRDIKITAVICSAVLPRLLTPNSTLGLNNFSNPFTLVNLLATNFFSDTIHCMTSVYERDGEQVYNQFTIVVLLFSVLLATRERVMKASSIFTRNNAFFKTNPNAGNLERGFNAHFLCLAIVISRFLVRTCARMHVQYAYI